MKKNNNDDNQSSGLVQPTTGTNSAQGQAFNPAGNVSFDPSQARPLNANQSGNANPVVNNNPQYQGYIPQDDSYTSNTQNNASGNVLNQIQPSPTTTPNQQVTQQDFDPLAWQQNYDYQNQNNQQQDNAFTQNESSQNQPNNYSNSQTQQQSGLLSDDVAFQNTDLQQGDLTSNNIASTQSSGDLNLNDLASDNKSLVDNSNLDLGTNTPIQNEVSTESLEEESNMTVNNSNLSQERTVDTQSNQAQDELITSFPKQASQLDSDLSTDQVSNLDNTTEDTSDNKNISFDSDPSDDIVFEEPKSTSSNMPNEETKELEENVDDKSRALDVATDVSTQEIYKPKLSNSQYQNEDSKSNKFDKKWYKNSNKNIEQISKNTQKLKFLTKPGLVLTSKISSQEIEFINDLANLVSSDRGRLILDISINSPIVTDLLKNITETNVKSTVIFYSPLESSLQNSNENFEFAKNSTFFYYSNYQDRLNFFVKESRYFVFFDETNHVSLAMLIFLIEMLSVYKTLSKPIFLYGEKWNAKIDEILSLLNFDQGIKNLINFVGSFDELQTKLFDLDNGIKKQKFSMPKVIDKRVYGDEKDFIILS